MNKLIDLACDAIKESKLIGLPTETVYGLAAPINRPELIEKIFTVKERPFFDPLIVHVSSVEMAQQLVTHWPSIATTLANTFWPGPLTLVLPKQSANVSDLITSGLSTVGLRMPNHPLALDLIKRTQTPMAAPSANKFTKVSPTKAEHVTKAFNEKDVFVLDGGACQVGIESTIVTFDDDNIILLRPGMISPDEITKVTGLSVIQNSKKIVSPGNMKVHYRPDYPLIIGEDIARLNEKGEPKINIEDSKIATKRLDGNPHLIARDLYQILRAPLPAHKEFLFLKIAQKDYISPLWEPIINRLIKAATYNLFE